MASAMPLAIERWLAIPTISARLPARNPMVRTPANGGGIWAARVDGCTRAATWRLRRKSAENGSASVTPAPSRCQLQALARAQDRASIQTVERHQGGQPDAMPARDRTQRIATADNVPLAGEGGRLGRRCRRQFELLKAWAQRFGQQQVARRIARDVA